MIFERTVVFLAVLMLSVHGDEQPQVQHPGSYFHDPKNVHDKNHIKEHLGEYYKEGDVDEQLKLDSEEAMEFHYFKLHDYDGNNKLDGLELGAAMTHYHEHNEEGEKEGSGVKTISLSDVELASLVTQILKEDDLNDDGFVDYFEFVQAQKGTNRGL